MTIFGELILSNITRIFKGLYEFWPLIFKSIGTSQWAISTNDNQICDAPFDEIFGGL